MRSGEQLHEIKCPSGMVFKALRPDVKIFYASGRLPEFLQNQMAIVQAAAKGSESAFEDEIKNNEELQNKILSNTRFLRDLILNHVKEPRIVEIRGSEDEIGFDELLPKDFDYLCRWMISGEGDVAAQAAETFRR